MFARFDVKREMRCIAFALLLLLFSFLFALGIILLVKYASLLLTEPVVMGVLIFIAFALCYAVVRMGWR